MLPPRPRDYPPLFDLGFHPMQLDEVAKVCVDAFPLLTSRKRIMDGLREFVRRLMDGNVIGELWLDGSFVTKKIDPKDVDIVLRIDGDRYNNGSPEVRAAVDWVIANQKTALLCDSYPLFEYPSSHALHDEGRWWYSYWHAKWGFSREEDPKGIIVVTLSGSGP
jgi:hypothetical protein